MHKRLLLTVLSALLLGSGLVACTSRNSTSAFVPATLAPRPMPVTAQDVTPPPTDDGGGTLPGR